MLSSGCRYGCHATAAPHRPCRPSCGFGRLYGAVHDVGVDDRGQLGQLHVDGPGPAQQHLSTSTPPRTVGLGRFRATAR